MHHAFLQQALTLAKLGKGATAPNPAVGAVVVKEGKVIGTGYHLAAGTPHAEIHALHAAGNNSEGATLYITLEPCCHQGRTPPCTAAIIAAKINHVYFAYHDPNPVVHHKGQQTLIDAGISCEHLSSADITHFYQSYQHWVQTKMPWITAKLALSLDGKIAHADGSPAVITNASLNAFTHQCRLHADALLTTINTVLHDDPQLNVRLNEKIQAKKIYVLDSQLQFPPQAKLLKTAEKLTLFHQADVNENRRSILEKMGICCIAVPNTKQGLDLKALCKIIGADGIHNLWVEAGSRVFSAFINAHLTQEVYLYIGCTTLGSAAMPAFQQPINFKELYKNIQWRALGNEAICHCTN